MPVWWLEGESESRVSWVLFPGWLLALHCPVSQLRQVTVCPLGNNSVAVKSARLSLGGPSRHIAKASSCPHTFVECIKGQAVGILLIVLFQNLVLKSNKEVQEGGRGGPNIAAHTDNG